MAFFSFQSTEIREALGRLSGWKLVLENKEANRGTCLIAQSITKDLRLQSYVSMSFVSWLQKLFVNESV